MTPEQRLRKAFELSKLSKELFKLGLRERFPNLPESEFRELFFKEYHKCDKRISLEDLWLRLNERGDFV
jgi:hypothetical protein